MQNIKQMIITVGRPVKKFFRDRRWNFMYAITFPRYYNRFREEPVKKKKILFVEQRYQQLSDNFRFLYERLQGEEDYEIHVHFLRQRDVTRRQFEKNCKAMLKDMATAGYVFLDDASKVLGRVKKRPETTVTQVWHACGAFKKFGMSTASLKFGGSQKAIEKYPAYSNLDYVTVSSPEVVWAYREAMNLEGKPTQVVPVGVSRTDVFFREENRKRALEKLYGLMPAARGKKVILYAPTFRGTISQAQSPKALNVERLQEALGEEYVLVTKHHPFVKERPGLPEGAKEVFAKDLTEQMAIEELLFVADACVSDYSSVIFEYALFERPMAFLAPDLSEYFDWRGFYYDYEELTPGPVFTNTEELTEYLLHLDEQFDAKRVRAFREKFMSACDGHATDRILELVLGRESTEGKRAY